MEDQQDQVDQQDHQDQQDQQDHVDQQDQVNLSESIQTKRRKRMADRDARNARIREDEQRILNERKFEDDRIKPTTSSGECGGVDYNCELCRKTVKIQQLKEHIGGKKHAVYRDLYCAHPEVTGLTVDQFGLLKGLVARSANRVRDETCLICFEYFALDDVLRANDPGRERVILHTNVIPHLAHRDCLIEMLKAKVKDLISPRVSSISLSFPLCRHPLNLESLGIRQVDVDNIDSQIRHEISIETDQQNAEREAERLAEIERRRNAETPAQRLGILFV